jgi:high-affinity iron transporter
MTLAALGTFILFTALGIGNGGHRSAPPSQYVLTPLATYSASAPHVLSTLVVNSTQGAVSGAPETPPSELPPVPASSFGRPVAEYRAYAIRQLGLMETQVVGLEHALTANDRAAAQEAWRSAYALYLRLGAVYLEGQVANLNQEIDGNSGGLTGGVANPRFTGLHRIEYGLWTAAAPRTLRGWAARLATDVHTLRGMLTHVSITPLEYATRAHEILEDAVRDLLSGADVPWSGEGVLATDAGLTATEEIVATLRPLLKERENTSPIVTAELSSLRAEMTALAQAHGGRLPTNGELSQRQSELLDGTLGGALEALAQVPGALETEPTPQIPRIPQRDVRLDP